MNHDNPNIITTTDATNDIKVIISNDYLYGINNETVMWGYLAQKLKNSAGVDCKTVNTTHDNPNFHNDIKKYIYKTYPHTQIIIQNATFMKTIDTQKTTIMYLQDNMREMYKNNPSYHENLLIQEENISKANILVTNSTLTTQSYPEYKFEIIPIGVNPDIFKPKDKATIKYIYGIPHIKKIGIFVGAFNNVKGWTDIKRIVDKRKDILFILVSKYTDFTYMCENTCCFNKIDQEKLSFLLNISDFFILGSKTETQCLAAIEAGMCGIPIIMRKTGIFMDFTQEERDQIGYFADPDEDLEPYIDKIFESTPTKFTPREIMLQKQLTTDDMIKKWQQLIDNTLIQIQKKQHYKKQEQFQTQLVLKSSIIKLQTHDYQNQLNQLNNQIQQIQKQIHQQIQEIRDINKNNTYLEIDIILKFLEEYDYSITIPSNKPEQAKQAQQALQPLTSNIYDGSNYPSFSKLINDVILSSKTDIIIILNDKARPTVYDIYKLILLLQMGFGFVAPYRFGFFGFHKDLIKKIGFLDERFIGGEYEDADFSRRLKEANIGYYEAEEIDYINKPSSWSNTIAKTHFYNKWKTVDNCIIRQLEEQTIYPLKDYLPKDPKPKEYLSFQYSILLEKNGNFKDCKIISNINLNQSKIQETPYQIQETTHQKLITTKKTTAITKTAITKTANKPIKTSIICLIYRSVKYLKFLYDQVMKYTDMTDKEFYFVANDANQNVIEYLQNSDIPYYIFNNTPENVAKHNVSEYFINNVYRAYNYSASVAKGEYLLFLNSDMAFSPNWYENLYKYIENNTNICVVSRLVESGRFESGQYGISKNYGMKLNEYDEQGFIDYAKSIAEDKLMKDGLYGPLLILKHHFLTVGGYPEGNISYESDIFNPVIVKKGENGIYGDMTLMFKLKTIGVSHMTSFSSIVYHFQSGELHDTEN